MRWVIVIKLVSLAVLMSTYTNDGWTKISEKKEQGQSQLKKKPTRPNFLTTKNQKMPKKVAAKLNEEDTLNRRVKSFLNNSKIGNRQPARGLDKAVSQSDSFSHKNSEANSKLYNGNGDVEKAESQVPLFKKKQIKLKSYPWGKMLFSFAIVVLFGGLLLAFAKWWKKRKNYDLGNTKIKVLTQYYLSPKKSLAIIRVAGEALLIGITDHNISKLKTLSFLDDEIPDDIPEDFERTLSHVDSRNIQDNIGKEALVTEGRSSFEERLDSVKGNSGQESTKRVLSQLRKMRSL